MAVAPIAAKICLLDRFYQQIRNFILQLRIGNQWRKRSDRQIRAIRPSL